MTNRNNDWFVRLDREGNIIEPYVTRLHIKNRKHPMHWYTQVEVTPKPEVPSFHVLNTTVEKTFDGRVVQKHTLEELSLDAVLRSLAVPSEDPLQPSTPPNIQDVDPNTINYIYKRIGDHFTQKLDAFARTRNYDNLVTLIGYQTSSVTKFQTEAQRGVYLRDSVWAALLPHFEKVLTGLAPVPISIAEVEALVPVFTWGDEEPEAPEVPEEPGEPADPETPPAPDEPEDPPVEP